MRNKTNRLEELFISLIANNKKIMKEHTNSKLSNALGIITLILMTGAAVALIYLQF